MKQPDQHQASLSLHYRVVVKDLLTERVISDSGLVPAHSFLLNWLLFLQSHFFHVAVSFTEMDGITRTFRVPDATTMAAFIAGAAGDVYTGIQLGNATTPVAFDNRHLPGLILHGTTTGRLSYAAHTSAGPTWAAPNLDFTISRILTNLSGAPITINEMGLIGRFEPAGLPLTNILLARDIIAPTTVPHNTSITPSYTIRSVI